MNLGYFLLILNFIVPSSQAVDHSKMTPWEVKLAKLKQGLPNDLSTLIDRIDTCHHFGGEDSYDAARKKEIEEQVRKFECKKLGRDESKLKQKYIKKVDLLQRLDEAKKLIGE